MLHQKNGNMYALNPFGLEATFVGLVVTLRQNQARLIACVDISKKQKNMIIDGTIFNNRQSAIEYQNKQLMFDIITQLSLQSKNTKHLWHSW